MQKTCSVEDKPGKPGQRAVAPITFSTEGLTAPQQLSAWREHCCPVIDITEAMGPLPGYAASFHMWNFGPFALSHVNAPGARFQRSPAATRRDGLDTGLIYLGRQGEHRFRTASGDAVAPAGQPHLLRLDEPMEGERSHADWLTLFFSRDAFPGLKATAPLHGAMTGLLAHYLEGLASSLPGMSEAELPHIVEATRSVLAASLSAAAPTGAPEAVHVERARFSRIRRIIQQNLASPRLGPGRLCQLAETSRSQLYRLFEPFGGVARFIQGERLARAHLSLSNAEDRRDILRIAEEVGFFDPSAFSRAFRREFAYSPSDLRMRASAGWLVPPQPLQSAAMPRNFGDALQRLSFHAGGTVGTQAA